MKQSGAASSFTEPYKHVDFELDNIPNESMRKLVARDLEQEHRDLGLGSFNDTKPPVSILGMALRQRHAEPAHTLINCLTYKAPSNVALTKLRIDLVHSEQSLEAVEGVGDRLPGNIVDLFDAGIRGLEEQSHPQRHLGVKAIAAATREFDGEPLATLKRCLQDAVPEPASVDILPGSREDVLRAAKGFLVAHPNLEDREIKAYHSDFHAYASEGYSESLFWAHSQLRNNTITRSSTLLDSLEPAPSDTQILDESHNSHEPLKMAVSAVHGDGLASMTVSPYPLQECY